MRRGTPRERGASNRHHSSAWLEYFAHWPNAGEFADIVEDASSLLVPSITLFEVSQRIRVQRDSDVALRAVAQMKRGEVIDLDGDLAIMAAELTAELRLPWRTV